MIRINLLPKELQERRRYEGYFIWVFVAAAVAAVLIIGVWFVLGLQVQSKTDDLQSRQELAADLQAEADAFSVFEQKQAALTSKQAIAQQALADRMNWAKISNEVSLVLPSDVYARAITANEVNGMEFTLTSQNSGDSVDSGQKSVARAMVRLNDLDSLTDVWLKSSARTQADGDDSIRQMEFQLSAQVVKPSQMNAASTSGTPATTPPSGQ